MRLPPWATGIIINGGHPEGSPPMPYGTTTALGSLASVALPSAMARGVYPCLPVAVKR